MPGESPARHSATYRQEKARFLSVGSGPVRRRAKRCTAEANNLSKNCLFNQHRRPEGLCIFSISSYICTCKLMVVESAMFIK